jgi:general secretion pathway protein D
VRGRQVGNVTSVANGLLPSTSNGFNLLIGNQATPHVIINALNQYTTTKILSNPSLVVILGPRLT